MKRTVIIGGGISGLALAHRLAELSRGAAHPITLLEASPRFGGLIETRRQDGFLLEGGPDGFLAEKPGAVELCQRLGIAGELVQTRADFRRLYVLQRGSLVEFERCEEKLRQQLARRFYGMEAGNPRYDQFVSLRDGLGRLVERLLEQIPEVRLLSSTPACGLERTGAGWKIHLQGAETLEAEALCLALPAPQAAGLTRSFAPQIADLLEEIRYIPVATVNLGFRKEDLPALPKGFGYVVPADAIETVLGCTFSDFKFPGRAPEGGALLRIFAGGSVRPEAVTQPDGTLVEGIRSELKRHLGLLARPRLVWIRRYPNAVPEHAPGNSGGMEALEKALEKETERWPGLYLTGCRGVGLPDRIRQAVLTAERMVQEIRQ